MLVAKSLAESASRRWCVSTFEGSYLWFGAQSTASSLRSMKMTGFPEPVIFSTE